MSKEPNRNVYVGHRYVPLILEEWDNKISYEGLSVVTHKGGSYTSKKRVPVGIDILNKEFWSLTGNYNAQVDYYREETERVADELDTKASHKEMDTFIDITNENINTFKTETDETINDFKNETTQSINNFKTETNELLDKKTDKTYVDDELDKKLDQTDFETFEENFEDIKISLDNNIDHIHRSGVSVMEFGVKADGVTDDTVALQRALDSGVPVLNFPQGTMLTGALYLKTNTDLIGSGMRKSILRGRFLKDNEDLLTVAIEHTYDGSGDVRGLRVEGLSFMTDLKGRDALHFGVGLSNTNAKIAHNYMNAVRYGLYASFDLTHSEITQNQWENAYLEFGDANKIHKNLMFGNGYGVTLDLIRGVRNNIIRDNTMVNNHGAVRIVNGDNIRIVNNQIEKIGENVEGTAMIMMVGSERPLLNTIISENNFGGGSYVDYDIYIGNADKTVIEKNNLIRGDLGHFNITSQAKNTIIKNDNYLYSWSNKPSLSTDVKDTTFINNGINTIGLPLKPLLFNNWQGGTMVKDESGLINMNEIEYGDNVIGAQMMKLPKHYRPRVKQLNVITDTGFKKLSLGLNGRVMNNIDLGEKVMFIPFTSTSDEMMNDDYSVYDDFLRSDSNSLGSMPTIHSWTDHVPGLEIVNNEVTVPEGSSLSTEFPMSTFTTGTPNGTLVMRVSRVPREVSDDIKMIFRYVNDDNYCYVQIKNLNGNKFLIRKRVNGVDTTIAPIWGELPNKVTVKIEMSGSTVKLYEDGLPIRELTIPDFLGSSTHGLAIKTRFSKVDAIGFNSN